MFVVARRIPRPPALNDCPPIAACSSDNSWLLFWLKHASQKRSIQYPLGYWTVLLLSTKPIFFKDTVICLFVKFIWLLSCVHTTAVVLIYTHWHRIRSLLHGHWQTKSSNGNFSDVIVLKKEHHRSWLIEIRRKERITQKLCAKKNWREPMESCEKTKIS